MNNGIIFDLDGTLLNTLEDIADAVNSMLSGRGWPVHPVKDYGFFVGNGMPMLVRRALPEHVQDEDLIKKCIKEVREKYSRNWAVKTAPYPGVLKILDHLKQQDIPMAVLSNKPHQITLEAVRHFFPGSWFMRIQGAVPEKAIKPDPEPALELAAEMDRKPEQVYLLGDSNVDMLTASKAGMRALGAAWGFRGRQELLEAGAKYILENPLDLQEFF
ncbi:MAG: HAD family hydrolase [Desulfonatronovibrionaceae bacterium]